MPIAITITPGWTFTTGDTATASALNALGNPTGSLPDGQTLISAAGTVSAPGIQITGDANTGFAQLGGGDTMSIVCGGAEPLRAAPTQVGFAAGALATPSLCGISDTDTGFYYSAANTMGWVCGGVLQATASTSGVDFTALSVGGLSVVTTGVSKTVAAWSTDFLESDSDAWGVTIALAGTATTARQTLVTGDSDGRGVLQINLLDAADSVIVSNEMLIASTSGIARFRVKPNNLSTPSERYTLLVGITSSAALAPAAGAWFSYTDSASAQWQTVTDNGASVETQTTAITYATGSWITLEIRHTAASTFAFYINGTLVSTHSTLTFSDSGNQVGIMVGLEKTVGSGNVIFYLDSMEGQTPVSRT